MIRFASIFILILFSINTYGQGKISRTTPSANKTSTKLSVSGTINGHDYVDLGLPSGTLWATCNIGSATPAGYGKYYAWTETKTKTRYTEDNCTTYKMTSYADGLPSNIKSDTIRPHVLIIGNPKYDAATANWGDKWVLSSASDFAELNKECKWELKTIDGHKGYLITGPNGNSMFLPMAGYMEDVYKSQVGSGGFYWTGDFWDDTRSTMFDFHESSHNGVIWATRKNGRSIRPVLRDRKPNNTIRWANEQ